MLGIDDLSKPIVDFANFDISQIGTALGFGLTVLLIGIVTVFAVLSLLWLFIYLFRLCFHNLLAKRSAKKTAAAPVNYVESAKDEPNTDEGEIIAVIAAAIAMAESECEGTRFRVVSFKRN